MIKYFSYKPTNLQSLKEARILPAPFAHLFDEYYFNFSFSSNNEDNIVLAFQGEILAHIIFIENNLPVGFIFSHELRFSFWEKNKGTVLYAIFIKNEDCNSTIYTVEHTKIILAETGKSRIHQTNKNFFSCTIFQESYAKLDLNLYYFKHNMLFEAKDREGKCPILISSFDLIENPAQRLQSYLQEIKLPSNVYNKQIFLNKTHHIISEFSKAEENVQSQIAKSISSNCNIFSALLEARTFLLQNNSTSEEKRFIELLIQHSKCSSNLLNTLDSPSIENRRKTALQKGTMWAYDIPEIISHAAEQFRIKYHLDSFCYGSGESEFIELDIDPLSIVKDKKTGLIDPNCGKIQTATDENGNPRPYGQNKAGIVIGVQTVDLGVGFPVKRLLLIGDLTHERKGIISIEECLRINAAIRYAYELKIPIDWFPASFGVSINMQDGVENLDASASTCREIVRYGQDLGLPINMIIFNTNIGAQSYWDALAAICMETHGILIMTSKGSMSLTGPQVLTSAYYNHIHSEDLNRQSEVLFPEGLQNLSNYQKIHGLNGEAMRYCQTLEEACDLLILHHYFTYIENNEGFVKKRPTLRPDSRNRNILNYKHKNKSIFIENEFNNIMKGLTTNRFAIIEALHDQDGMPILYWWPDARGPEINMINKGSMPQTATTIVAVIKLGGKPTFLIFPSLGPLAPLDSEIIAKAICKASGRLSVLIMGNLTGFNSDPLSMENYQLTRGASIVRAIARFHGKMVVINLANLVGGTFVVFSKQLNPALRMLAIKGAKVQVVGGSVAAKIVFHSRIRHKAEQDPRLQEILQKNKIEKHKGKSDSDQYMKIFRQIIDEIEKEEEKIFDQIHNAKRAKEVGSIDGIVTPSLLRKAILDEIEF